MHNFPGNVWVFITFFINHKPLSHMCLIREIKDMVLENYKFDIQLLKYIS